MIKIEGVSKKVENQVLLDEITCKIDQGLTFITGDSGAGKTTFLNLIGLLDPVSAGKIEYLGENYSYNTESINADFFRANHLGWVFQESNLISGLTVQENICLAASLSSSALDTNDASILLNKFLLEKLKDKKIDVLSGGEKQRVSIVRALVKGADIILADEPTGNLDSRNSEIIFKTLKEIAKDKTVIVVTHNTEKAHEYGDHILHLKDGQLADDNWITSEETNKRSEIGSSDKKIVKRKLSKQYIQLLSKNYFSKVTSKIRTIVFASAIVIASAGIIFSLGKTAASQINEMNLTYYDADIVDIMPDYSLDSTELVISAGEGSRISHDEQTEIEKNGYFKKKVPMITWPLYLEGTLSELNIKYVETDDFFYERYGKTELTGEFPTSQHDIVLGKDIAEEYYGDINSAIGEEISLENDYGNKFTYIISGVNEHKNIDGIYYNYIPTQSIIGNKYNEFVSELYEKEAIESDSVTFVSCLSGVCKPYSKEFKIAAGMKPTEDGEIIVSASSFVELCDFLFDAESTAYDEWDFINLDDEQMKLIRDVFSREYLINANETYNVKIVGVYDGKSDIMLGTEEWVDAIYKIEPTMLQCYTDDLSMAQKYGEFVFPEGLTFESYYEDRFSAAIEMGNMWKLILLAVTVLVILLTVVMINSFTKISISQRRYELGVLKALGASSDDMVNMLLYDSFSTGLMTGMTALIFYLSVAFYF